jgi:ring-1,2-phenylacetyl-CoA epoxidase subunit PaaD
MVTAHTISIEKIRALLENVMDPEVPVLSVLDLGIVRDIVFKQDPVSADTTVEIVITPTYSGCPAMDVIGMNIKMELLANGFNNVLIRQTLSPAWTTDWMTEQGKQRLREYGIAPPNPKQAVCHPDLFAPEEAVQCPHCNSYHTHRISEFGSTACKSLHQCDDCKEPFDYFKCH